jgi:hypothetical protein
MKADPKGNDTGKCGEGTPGLADASFTMFSFCLLPSQGEGVDSNGWAREDIWVDSMPLQLGQRTRRIMAEI